MPNNNNLPVQVCMSSCWLPM